LRSMIDSLVRSVSLLVLAGAAAACGPSGAGLCDARCECEGCSQFDYDLCVRDADGEFREADFRGCGFEYDEFIACQNATAVCFHGDYETSCKFERDRWKRCVD
jgi:hypothetical protein